MNDDLTKKELFMYDIFKDLESLATTGGHLAKVMIYGQQGTGKSTAAATMAEIGNVLWFYFPGEEGLESVHHYKHADKIKPVRITDPKEMFAYYTALLKGDHDFQTVVIDPVSELIHMKYRQLLNLPPDATGPIPDKKFAFWEELEDWSAMFAGNWWGLANRQNKKPINVVMTSQAQFKGDEFGDSTIMPLMHKGPRHHFKKGADFIFYTHIAEDPEDLDRTVHALRIKPAYNVEAKMHTDIEKAKKLPAVLGLDGKQVKLPHLFHKQLGVKLKKKDK